MPSPIRQVIPFPAERLRPLDDATPAQAPLGELVSISKHTNYADIVHPPLQSPRSGLFANRMSRFTRTGIEFGLLCGSIATLAGFRFPDLLEVTPIAMASFAGFGIGYLSELRSVIKANEHLAPQFDPQMEED